MKKFITALTSVLAVVLLALTLAGCSANYVGTYKINGMKVNMGGLKMEYTVGEEFLGVTITEDAFVLEIKDGGTFTITTNMVAQSSQDGTWEQKDGKLYLTIEGETQQAVLDGDMLTMTTEEEGMSMELTFKKQ